MQGDYDLQPRIISVCMKLHNFCNRDSRDQLGCTTRDSPSVDEFFDLSSERDRRGVNRRGQGVRGRSQPLSRNLSNNRGRLPLAGAVRVYTRPPDGWGSIPRQSHLSDTSIQNCMCKRFPAAQDEETISPFSK